MAKAETKGAAKEQQNVSADNVVNTRKDWLTKTVQKYD